METAGLATVKTAEAESPPPGAGVRTLTVAVPGNTVSPVGMAAVSVEELTKLVARAEPFHWTTEDGSKLEPETVSVRPGPPAAAELGAMEARTGTGLGI